MEGESRGAQWGLLHTAPGRCLDQISTSPVEAVTGETKGENLLAPDGHKPMLRQRMTSAPAVRLAAHLRDSPL